MIEYATPFFCPDLDCNWAANPGALSDINGFAPLQNGDYGTIGTATQVSFSAGDNHVIAYMFRQVDNSVRFLTFRTQDIDEYAADGTRTNRGTSYTATTMWSAAAWGNQIIACNLQNATQSSTGAGFSALGGGSPKARMVAANVNFAMMADVDDSGSNVYSDMVWWSGIRNPATWTPSAATQAGNVRLLDSPGPIKALVGYNNQFIAFKENSIFVGDYIGPPYVFGWRRISSRIGCVGQNAVTELDGKLYFLHASGFYVFDGQSIRNVGLPVFQSYMQEAKEISGFGGLCKQAMPYTSYGAAKTQAVADDAEGVAWFCFAGYSSNNEYWFLYGYNARANKWSRHNVQISSSAATNSGVAQSPLVRANTSDLRTFVTGPTMRFAGVWNASTSLLRGFKYVAQSTDSVTPSYTTGVFGDQQEASTAYRFYNRARYVGGGVPATVTVDSGGTETSQSLQVSASKNTAFDSWDFMANHRYKKLEVAYSSTAIAQLCGLSLGLQRAGRA